MTETIDEVDGRRLRREQNRDAVIGALVALFDEGIYQPRSAQIAERAGLSSRSLFRYFDDVDDLNRAAIERQLDRARPLLEVGVTPDDPTPVKIVRVVDARIRLFEAIGPTARAARVCAHRHPVVAAQIRDGRSFLRHQLERVFAPELAVDRAGLLPAVDALCSFETHELMRHDQGLSKARTAASLAHALSTLLDPEGRP
ncbi:MAG: TetR/AcrR family transcriptional regulator [Acidimicrobiales bacterium]